MPNITSSAPLTMLLSWVFAYHIYHSFQHRVFLSAFLLFHSIQWPGGPKIICSVQERMWVQIVLISLLLLFSLCVIADIEVCGHWFGGIGSPQSRSNVALLKKKKKTINRTHLSVCPDFSAQILLRDRHEGDVCEEKAISLGNQTQHEWVEFLLLMFFFLLLLHYHYYCWTDAEGVLTGGNGMAVAVPHWEEEKEEEENVEQKVLGLRSFLLVLPRAALPTGGKHFKTGKNSYEIPTYFINLENVKPQSLHFRLV